MEDTPQRQLESAGRWKHALLTASIAVSSTVVLLWPVLFGGKILANSWLWYGGYFSADIVGQSLRAGNGFPTWTDTYLSGHPFTRNAGAASGVYNPATVLFAWATDGFTAIHFTIALDLILAFVCTYAFGRLIGVSTAAALVLAASYTFSQWGVEQTTLNHYANALAFLPFIFLITLRFHRASAIRYMDLSIAVAGIFTAAISALPDAFVISLLGAMAFGVYLDATHTIAPGSGVRRYMRTVGRLILAGALALGPALVFLLPTFTSVPLTWRDEPLTITDVADGTSLSDAIQVFFPKFPSLPYLPQHPWVHAGIITMMLAAVYLLIGLRRRSIAAFFAGSAASMLLLTVRYSPLYWLLHHLPIINTQRYPFKLLPLLFFSVAVLAAFGLDELRSQSQRQRLDAVLRVLRNVAVLLCAVGVGSALVFQTPLLSRLMQGWTVHATWMMRSGAKSSEHYASVLAPYWDALTRYTSPNNPQFIVTVVVAFVAAAILTAVLRGQLSSRAASTILAVACVTSFPLLWRGAYSLADAAEARKLRSPLATVRTLGGGEPYRIFNPFPRDVQQSAFDQDAYIAFMGSAGRMHWNTYFGVDSIASEQEPLIFRRQTMLLSSFASFGHPFGNGTPLYGSLSEEARRGLLNKYRGTLSMMNVRYLITPFTLESPWISHGTTTGFVIPEPLNLYENPDVLPRAFFPEQVSILPIDEVATLPVMLQNDDFRKRSFIECEACETLSGAGSASATFVVVRPGYYTVQTKTESRQWLVVTESITPYWRISIDGTRVESQIANYVYHGILVPAGSHVVTLEFPGIWGQFVEAAQSLWRDPFQSVERTKRHWTRVENLF